MKPTGVETYTYDGMVLQIVPEMRKNKLVYWFVVNQNPVTFVSKKDKAIRLGVNFIEVVKSKEHETSRQGFVSESHRQHMSETNWRKGRTFV